MQFVMLTNLTTEGVQTLKSNPARITEVNKEMEQLGIKVINQWATLGQYDFVTVVEAPGHFGIGTEKAGPGLGRDGLPGHELEPNAYRDPGRRVRGGSLIVALQPQPERRSGLPL